MNDKYPADFDKLMEGHRTKLDLEKAKAAAMGVPNVYTYGRSSVKGRKEK